MSLHDDPRLTAYALGELDAAERAEIETLLASDPSAQAEVDAIRSMAALLEGELADEAAPSVDEALRADVLEGPGKSRAWMLWASGLAAAAAAVGLFVLSTDGADTAPARRALSVASAPADKSSARRRRPPPAVAPKAYAPKSIAQHAFLPRAPVSQAPRSSAPRPVAARSAASRAPRSWAAAPATYPPVAPATHAPVAPVTTVVPDPNARPIVRSQGEVTAALGNTATVGKKGPQQQWQYRGDKKIASGFIANPDPAGGDRFIKHPENPFTQPTLEPLSTFSIDVDTASYSMVRSQLTRGRRPQPGAVRIEEMLNYFDYDYAPPVDGQPFATHVEVASAPWAPKHRLVRVGLKGKMVERPRANLVFLLDVSGSMSARNKLPLLKDAMATLVDSLHPDDRVAIVVYAGASGLVLPSTPAKNKRAILGALDRLKSGGGTNGGAGIEQAYWVAAQNFIQGGVNRVIIGTDGDFNVGTTSRHTLVEMVEQRAQGGIALTVLGFGMGNYNDATLEQLADKGDGNYAYIDTADEARKVLVDQLDGTLVTIAKDVKIQVEFNPAQVAAYRLIGYENRKLAAQDFNDDTKDAGEIGAGHTVTALYEVIPTGVPGGRAVDPLKYQAPKPVKPVSREMLTLKLRYKAPTGGRSQLISGAVIDNGAHFNAASADLRFAASVAAFGMLLRGSPHAGSATLDAVLGWASDAVGKDEWRYRQGFLDLVRSARGRY